jgi:hypothetical protein
VEEGPVDKTLGAVHQERESSPGSDCLERGCEEDPRIVGMVEEGIASLPSIPPWLGLVSQRSAIERCTEWGLPWRS